MEGGYYEKGNLEIHSSDAGGDTDRYCDYSRRNLVYGDLREAPAALTVAGVILFAVFPISNE